MRTAKTRITKTNKKIRNQKGITLVALVVTIVVLIILATISIQAVFSDSGIIRQAERAKEAQANAQASDSEAMGSFEQYLANTIAKGEGNNGSGGEDNPPETPKGPNGKPLVTALTEIQGTTVYAEDRLGNSVTVPGGFKVVAGELVQDGIVIEDDNITTYEDGTTSTGNQFVWIPVSNIDQSGNNKIKVENADKTVSEVEITLGRYTFARVKNAETGLYEDGTPTLKQKGSDYAATALSAVEAGTVTNYMIENNFSELKDFREADQSSTSSKINATAKDLKGFVESVRDNKGYYLARYEASYESGDTFGVGVAPEGKTYRKPASKISKYNSTSSMSYTAGTLWNYITQGNASKVSRQMYYGNSFLESDLCNSYAWDTAIVYIQAMGNSNYANAYDGNGTLHNTGDTTRDDQKCHIYDMAGNESEWTTEYSADTASIDIINTCVSRGGSYSNSVCCTSYRSRNTAPLKHRQHFISPFTLL